MSNVGALYHRLLLDHGKSPRNFGPLPGASHHAQRDNPLCGDQFTVHVKVSGDLIVDAGFEGAGCAISMASASMMTASIKGMTSAQAEDLSDRFDRMVSTPPGDIVVRGELGELAAFAGVAEFPVRVECARLPWRALAAALAPPGDRAK